MKKSLVSFLLICTFLANAQEKNTVPIQILKLDSITAIGKADGKEITKEIGKEGGKIVSEDGKMELIFPEGAISKKKKISIQPIINHVANGRGKAYRMEPSGIQFDKPVTLVYYYSENELSGSLAELKGLATQDEKGKWEALQEITLDTLAKTITSQIRHFSNFGSFDRVTLVPVSARVKVENTLSLYIRFVHYQQPAPASNSTNANEDFLPNLPTAPSIPMPTWEVNGLVNGNSNVGWITNPSQSTHAVTYNAPTSVPEDNPVAVTVHLKGLTFRFNRQVFNEIKLVSNLLIYDKAYRVKMDVWIDNSEDGQCTMRMEDHGEFTVVMDGNRTHIKEIVNQNLQLTINPCYNCTPSWMNQPQCKGPINTIGTRRIDITPASLPNNPFTHLRIFLLHAPSPLPNLKYPCPPTGGKLFHPQPILPSMFEFDANQEQERIITLSELSNGSVKNDRRQGLKITITRIDE